MAINFDYDIYEISIDKRSDCVYIQFLDTKFYKLYSKNYLDTDILQYNMTLDIFYKVIQTVFTALVEENESDAIVKIIPSNKYLKLDIHHKYYIEFIFELSLDLETDNSLEQKIFVLKN